MANEISEVRQLLASVAGDQTVETLSDEELFFENRMIDSLHLVAIVDRFQSEFGIKVSGQDLSPDNFGSIAAMAKYLRSKRGSDGADA
jgi:acyl carrier protein